MKPIRDFLGWERPLLESVCDRIIGEREKDADYSNWLIIVGTAQAGRRLRQELARRSSLKPGAVIPPRIVTTRGFLDFAASGRDVVDPVTCLREWAYVLCECEAASLNALIPHLPKRRDIRWALPIARRLIDLRMQLSEGDMDFGAIARNSAVTEERVRWEQLAAIEVLYRRRLTHLKLSDRADLERTFAANPSLSDEIEKIVLIALADPVPLMLLAFERLTHPCEAHIWIHAPEEKADCFDAWGRVTEYALAEPLDIPHPTQRIHIASDDEEQAILAATLVCSHARPAHAIVVGGADASVLDALERELDLRGIAVFNPAGQSIRSTELTRFLELLIEITDRGTIDALLDLVRLPSIARHLSGSETQTASITAALDTFIADRLPVSFEQAFDLLKKRLHSTETAHTKPAQDLLRSLFDTVAGWIAMMRSVMVGSAEPLHELLSDVFGAQDFDERKDSGFLTSSDTFIDLVNRYFENVPGRSESMCEMVALALAAMPESRVINERSDDAVELSGWLELPWIAAPHLVLTGCNEERLPGSVRVDAFLPDSVRHSLGLPNNRTRLYRDAMVLRALIGSRGTAGCVDLLFGKFSGSGEALSPSRLLLLCSPEELPKRVLQVFGDPPKRRASVPWSAAWQLRPEAVLDERPHITPQTVSVTALRDYLTCPFRFALRHVLGMHIRQTTTHEMDALAFGHIIHAALEGLLRDAAMRDCADPEAIQAHLLSGLDACLTARYGNVPALPVSIQSESAQERLAAVARVIASWRSDGWRPLQTEWDFELNETITETPIRLRGKIDLIEVRERDGALRLIDFKTSDSAISPSDAHLKKKRSRSASDDASIQWIDLQLPMYAWAAQVALPVTYNSLEIGYCNLPKAVSETAWMPWKDWQQALFDDARETAREAMRRIHAHRFWPPGERIKYDEYADWFLHDPARFVIPPVYWEGG